MLLVSACRTTRGTASTHQTKATLLAVSACRRPKPGAASTHQTNATLRAVSACRTTLWNPDTASIHQTSTMLLIDRAGFDARAESAICVARAACAALPRVAQRRGPGDPTSPCCRISPRNFEVGIARRQHHARRLGSFLDGCSRGVVERCQKPGSRRGKSVQRRQRVLDHGRQVEPATRLIEHPQGFREVCVELLQLSKPRRKVLGEQHAIERPVERPELEPSRLQPRAKLFCSDRLVRRISKFRDSRHPATLPISCPFSKPRQRSRHGSSRNRSKPWEHHAWVVDLNAAAPNEDPFYAHFPHLKTMLRDTAVGRHAGVLLRFATNDAFMNQWDITMRYAPRAGIIDRLVQGWQAHARSAIAAMEDC